jgi:hypothetical protein
MKRKQNLIRSARVALLAVLLALSGCLPESVHPVAPPDAAGGDARLLGAWLHVSEDGYGVYHVFETDRPDWDFEIASHDVGSGRREHPPFDASGRGDYLNVLVSGSETGYLSCVTNSSTMTMSGPFPAPRSWSRR